MAKMHLEFEWDENKSLTNVRKHRVDFEEAKTVFNDPLVMTMKKNNANDTMSMDLASEYDFSRAERGKHYEKYRAGHTVKITKPDGSMDVK